MTAAPSTRDRLIGAATAEFEERGFGGTDTNRIARRAGFAPQTFYRWFKDKTAIFLAVYRAWEDAEYDTVSALLAGGAGDAAIASAVIAHHRAYRVFRRSLRTLSVEQDEVRRARAETRLRQAEQIRLWAGPDAPPRETIAVNLLVLERLSDAVAEGEFADMGLSDAEAVQRLAQVVGECRVAGSG
jgi:AcrR family transcriptional regulator